MYPIAGTLGGLDWFPFVGHLHSGELDIVRGGELMHVTRRERLEYRSVEVYRCRLNVADARSVVVLDYEVSTALVEWVVTC